MVFLLYLALISDSFKKCIQILFSISVSIFIIISVTLGIGTLITFLQNNDTIWLSGLMKFLNFSIMPSFIMIGLFVFSFIIPSTKNFLILTGVSAIYNSKVIDNSNKLIATSIELLTKKVKGEDK